MTHSIFSAISVAHARWLILIVFPATFISAYNLTGSAESGYFLGPAMFACATLIYRLNSKRIDFVAVWLVILVFLIFYVLRYPLYLLDPNLVDGFLPLNVEEYLQSDSVGLHEALKLSCFGFVVFCLTARSQLPKVLRTPCSNELYPPPANIQFWNLLPIIVISLLVVLGYISHVYSIGQMGVAPGEPLPFRLKGIIFYARHVTITLFILAILFLATLSKSRHLRIGGLFLLFIHGVSDAILRGSKSSLLLCFLLILFLIVSGGFRVSRRGWFFLGMGVIGAVSLMPIIMDYRVLRFEPDAGLWQSLASAFHIRQDNIFGSLLESLRLLYFRIPGIETIWAISGLIDEPLGFSFIDTVLTKFGVAGYLSHEIYEVSPDTLTLYAPGYFGWLYLAGGWMGLLIGNVILALLCVWVPRWLYAGYMRWPPVANAFFLWILFISLTDGALDSNFLLIAAGITTLLALEFCDRMIARSS